MTSLRPIDYAGHVPELVASPSRDLREPVASPADAVTAAWEMGYTAGRLDALSGDLARRVARLEERAGL